MRVQDAEELDHLTRHPILLTRDGNMRGAILKQGKTILIFEGNAGTLV